MNYELLLKSQIYYLTNIVFILTILFKSRVMPLNMIVLLGSIYFLHIKINFSKKMRKNTSIYDRFHKKIPRILLITHDLIFHWGPFLYTLKKIKDNQIDWYIVFMVLVVYPIFTMKHLNNIYFDTEIYYSL
jgi:hypothetical protein